MMIFNTLFEKYKGELRTKILISGVITSAVTLYSCFRFESIPGNPILLLSLIAVGGFLLGCFMAMYLIAGNVIQAALNHKDATIGSRFALYCLALLYALSLLPVAGGICYLIYLIIT